MRISTRMFVIIFLGSLGSALAGYDNVLHAFGFFCMFYGLVIMIDNVGDQIIKATKNQPEPEQ